MTRRREMMIQAAEGGGLPTEYQQVEWLRSNGAYIVTDLPFTSRHCVEYEAKSGSYNAAEYFMGYPNRSPRYGIFGGNYPYYYFGNQKKYILYANCWNKWSVFKTNGRYATIDDDSHTIDSGYDGADFSCGTLAMYVTTHNDSYWYNNDQGLFMKYFKVTLDGFLVADYIPCYRKADNKPGMYDLINKQFYTAYTDKEFIAGDDIA